jgi:hypothetical protein
MINTRTAPAAVAALLCVGLAAGCGTKTTGAVDGSTTAPTTPATSTTTTPTTPVSTATGGPAAMELVYYATTTPLGKRITAEPTAVSGSDPLSAALVALLKDAPIDPDYSSDVPKGSLTAAVHFDGVGNAGTYQVTVSAAKWATMPAGMTAAQAKSAVQQIAYTLNVAGGTTKAKVAFMLGAKTSTYLGQPASVVPGKPLLTLALMSVLSPADGSTLTATKTTFSGVGSSFEAAVGWKVTSSAGKTVLQGHTMSSGWMDKLYPWKANVDLSKLAAGTYTFTASTDDASDGEGGGPIIDTKTFTIG